MSAIAFATIETDESLVRLMERAQAEVFGGNAHEFEEAYSEALATQIIELLEADDFSHANLAEELVDTMCAVLLQWLGEYPCFTRTDPVAFLLKVVEQQ